MGGIAVAITVLFYEYFLTLPEEIRLVWPRPFTQNKFVYLYLRYGVMATCLVGTYGAFFSIRAQGEMLTRFYSSEPGFSGQAQALTTSVRLDLWI